MEIKFKVLSVNTEEHTITVRYFSDLVSEDSLATEFDLYNQIIRDKNGYPTRCRTDINIAIREYPCPSEEKLKKILSAYAPVDFFKSVENKLNPAIDTSMSSAFDMINKVYKVEQPQEENLITDEEIDKLLNELTN